MIDRPKREVLTSLSSLFGREKKEGGTAKVRPPYNQVFTLFEKKCPECIDAPCVNACEEEIIALDDKKIPYIVFTKSGCTFCEECARACPHEVLHGEPHVKATLKAKFSINTAQCLAWNATICRSCADVCDAKAIPFFGMFRPLIETDKCTGCGFCVSICPTEAITFKPYA